MKLERSQIMWQGLVAGLIGYATVAIVFAVVNVATGHSPFHTAALLGSAFFYGLKDPAQLTVWPGPIFAYNGFHLLVFLALGVVAAWLAFLAERGPHFWYIGAVLLVFVSFHLFGALMLVTQQVRAALSVWTMLVAGFAALAAMAAYLVWAHPKIREEFRDFAAHDADLAETR